MSCLAISPFVESPRLRLRGPCERHLPRLAELANDYDVVKMTGSMPYPYRLEDARTILDKAASLDPRREAMFVIEHDGGPIGVLSFVAGPHGRVEIGYWLGRPYWGKGIATDAVRAAMDWAGSDCGKRVDVPCHNAANPASGQVLINAGFLYTGDVEMKFSKARGDTVPVRWMVWLA